MRDYALFLGLDQIFIRFSANLAPKFRKFMQELHLLFGMNLATNISTKAKGLDLILNKHFLVLIRCRFNTHFSWVYAFL